MSVCEVLGLDVGEKWIGVARGSTAAKLAEPLTTIETNEASKNLQELINNHKAAALVVGLPRNLSGDDTAQTDWVRQWVDQLKNRIDLPVLWQDEALTSKQAEISKPKAKSPFDDHALAAATILQDFLDSPAAGEVGC